MKVQTTIVEFVNVALNSNTAILKRLCTFHRKTYINHQKENNLLELCSQIYVRKLAYRWKTLNVIQLKFAIHVQEKS
jgi:hypothetical protein